MKSFNQVLLLGNLGKDPKVLKPSDRGAFVRLSIATMKKYKDANGEWQEDTQWHTVYLNNKPGKATAEYLKKGSRVQIIGELRKKSWMNKEGKSQFNTAVYASDIIFLGCAPKSADIPEQPLIVQ